MKERAVGKIVNSTFISLDGVINHMERWHFDFIDAEVNALAWKQLEESDALLMGRHTYDAYAGVWPSRSGEYADRINAMDKYVVSSTLKLPKWQNTTVLANDVLENVAKLRREHSILMHGYGQVAKLLVRAGLLDELVLWVHPMFAGVGTMEDMLFSEGLNERLTLLDTKSFASGVVILRYQVN